MSSVEEMKLECKSTVALDAKRHSESMLSTVNRRRGGKFKLSETQFKEAIQQTWISGELCGAERILRFLDLDPELNNRDLIRGEIHIYLLDLLKILRKYAEFEKVDLEDLLWGKFSAEDYVKESLCQKDN